MKIPQRLELILDEDDARDVYAEIANRKNRELPDGDSNIAGATIAEIVRDLWEYRGIYNADRDLDDAAKRDSLKVVDE